LYGTNVEATDQSMRTKVLSLQVRGTSDANGLGKRFCLQLVYSRPSGILLTPRRAVTTRNENYDHLFESSSTLARGYSQFDKSGSSPVFHVVFVPLGHIVSVLISLVLERHAPYVHSRFLQ
jgi:hypothetical protein